MAHQLGNSRANDPSLYSFFGATQPIKDLGIGIVFSAIASQGSGRVFGTTGTRL